MPSPSEYFARVQASPGWLRVLESFARFVEPQAGWRTLDVGCGPGALVRLLAAQGCVAEGVDADEGMVASAQELAPQLTFQHGSIYNLPYASHQFNLVTATNVVFLQKEPLAAVQEMARVCAPGGVVAMLNPSPRLSRETAQAHARASDLTDFAEFSFVNWGTVAERNHRFSAEAAQQMFAEAGLTSIETAEKIGEGLALLVKGFKAS
jgi:ubiquinone/menaquinone biosynthesis C-methylase UbiE